ncbi:MAG: segregation/condensation protein A [Acidobacteriota bacterium]
MENDKNLNPELDEISDKAGITVRLEAFEGPLDLLLHLIRKDEIDIWNIPIAHITEQYLEYLQIMKDLNINLAAEWLTMASTLIYIKSRMLVPEENEDEGEEEDIEDPRHELVYQLLEHQKFKNAAEMLYTREEVENAVWNRPPEDALEDANEIVAVSLFDLLKAFHEVVRRFEDQKVMEVAHEEVTVEQKIEEIRRRLLVHNQILFSALFAESRTKRHMIVTFLALLELVRMNEIFLFQKKAFQEIQITKNKGIA